MLDRTHTLRSFGSKAALIALTGVALLFAACGSSSSTTTATGPSCPNTKSLNASGATFPALLYEQAFGAYAQKKCGIQVNYQPVGSGAGQSALLAATVDFAGTDAYMTDATLAKSTNGPILHIPAALGGIAMSYNLTAAKLPSGTQVKFKGKTIADIFLGKVKFWDDAEITADNSGVTLPHEAITVVHRSDGSGTTGIFTNYLSQVSPDWKAGPGQGTTVTWPTGVGAKGNDGVAQAVKTTEGALGYNELGYVLQNGITYGTVQNADGTAFLSPTVATVSAAAAAVTTIPDDLRFYITNEPGAQSYPISGFSFIVVYQKQSDSDKGAAVVQALWYLTHDGQVFAAPSYTPIPANIVAKDEAQIKKITCGSSACFTSFIQ
jgi:phosphate transport system substrate-binding protein